MNAIDRLTCAEIAALALASLAVGFAGSLMAQQPIARNDVLTAGLSKDGGKLGIEFPTKRIIANTAADPLPKSDFINPRVAAGRVRWHTSYASARQASEKSGKPVLLFQMMGKLDDQFC
jgi:hypothetical protein